MPQWNLICASLRSCVLNGGDAEYTGGCSSYIILSTDLRGVPLLVNLVEEELDERAAGEPVGCLLPVVVNGEGGSFFHRVQAHTTLRDPTYVRRVDRCRHDLDAAVGGADGDIDKLLRAHRHLLQPLRDAQQARQPLAWWL